MKSLVETYFSLCKGLFVEGSASSIGCSLGSINSRCLKRKTKQKEQSNLLRDGKINFIQYYNRTNKLNNSTMSLQPRKKDYFTITQCSQPLYRDTSKLVKLNNRSQIKSCHTNAKGIINSTIPIPPAGMNYIICAVKEANANQYAQMHQTVLIKLYRCLSIIKIYATSSIDK